MQKIGWYRGISSSLVLTRGVFIFIHDFTLGDSRKSYAVIK